MQAGQQYESFKYIQDVTSFFLEASAESALYNINHENYDYYSYSYFLEREYEALFFLLSICNEDVNISDYYNAIFDTDLLKLYEFVGCKKEEDISHFYKILGSMDVALGRNPHLDDSFKKFQDTRNFIGYDYKIDIFNSVLADMVTYTCNHNDFSLEDNLTLFKIVKTVLSSNTHTDVTLRNGRYESVYDPKFVIPFKNIENVYYTFLSFYYGVNTLEMEQIEENYANEMINRIRDISENTLIDTSYRSEEISLLDRFPLLSPIFKAISVSPYEYDFFVEDTSILYEKKK